MKGATFKNPYTLTDEDKIPHDLFNTITTYLKGRKHLAAETIEENSLKISTIILSIYASKDFCKKVDGKTIFQIGEESFACPFYRSFNDNASCIPFFTKAMKALFESSNVESNKISSNSLFSISTIKEDPIEYYQHRIQGLVNSEIRTIHYLNFGIEMLETSIASSQSIPKFTGSKLNLKSGGKTFLNEVNRAHQTDKTEHTSSLSTCVLI